MTSIFLVSLLITKQKKPMIRLILSGGLGNQMFQYAAGKALSIKTNLELSIDKQILEKKTKATHRNYELNIFGIDNIIQSQIGDKISIKAFLLLNKFKIPSSKLLGIFKDEKAQYFDLRFRKLSNNVLLYGYFQNEFYFNDISEQLRQDFTFKDKLKGENKEIEELILNNKSVSLHIRRGDYLNQESNLRTLDIEYYQNAINYISSKIDNPYFIIFSDDMNWVKNNLSLKNHEHTYIDWNKTKNSYKDMQLMSLCNHNIIANSSFSWWGAWLNNNPQKMVIVPSSWYKNEKKNNYPDGFIPNGWIIL